MSNFIITLMSGRTTNGTGAAQALPFDPDGGRVALTIYVTGTFGTASVGLEASPDGVVWVPLADYAFTSATVDNLDIAAHSMRAVVSGATTGTSLTVILRA